MGILSLFRKSPSQEEIKAEEKLFSDLKKLYQDVKDEINLIPTIRNNVVKIKNHLEFNNLNRRDMEVLLEIEKILTPALNFEHKIEHRFNKIEKIQKEFSEKIGVDVSKYNQKVHDIVDSMVIDFKKENTLGTAEQQRMARFEIDKLHEEVDKTRALIIPLVTDLETFQKKNIEQNMEKLIDFEKNLSKELDKIFDLSRKVKNAGISFSTNDMQEINKIAKECYETCTLYEAFLNGVEATLRSYVDKVAQFEDKITELIKTSDKRIEESKDIQERYEKIKNNPNYRRDR